jgi:hypothetical protein
MHKPEERASGDLTVYISSRESKCDECGEDLGRHGWIVLTKAKRAVCLACADLDHLVFLPAGEAALTRRARKHSRLSALVLKWSRTRKRYERQGLLVEDDAVGQAERECEADAEIRATRRDHAALRRAELDERYVAQFATRVRELYPHCPVGREGRIAEHACRKYSGRVGRSAAAKALDENSVRLAVAAHVRHTETDYDDLLVSGCDRHEARQRVNAHVSEVLTEWKHGRSEGPVVE